MGLGNIIGAVLFNPDKEKLYRKIAFLIITLSALTGLPLLSDSFDSFVGRNNLDISFL
jgi:hypothetical protein